MRQEVRISALVCHCETHVFFYEVYLDRAKQGVTGWPLSPLVDGVPDIESVEAALKVGPYGRCVYECDNDVVDNQVIFLIFILVCVGLMHW